MVLEEIHWTTQAGYPVLGTLQLLPLLGLALMLLVRESRGAANLGLALLGVELLVALDLFRRFVPGQPGLQLGEQLSLPGALQYHAAIDGVSLIFMMLTALLALMVGLYGRVRNLAPARHYLALVFAVELALQGMFATRDLLAFVLLYAVELVAVAYLLWHWATSGNDSLAMRRYMQFMSTGLLLLLAGVFLLGWNHAQFAGHWSFELTDLMAMPIPTGLQSVLFFLLFYALAIRTPLFPLHGWLPLIAEHGTVASAGVFLLGLKVGVYGLLRFVFPLLPEAVVQWQPWVVAFAVAGIFYAALMALLQVNLRRLLAFAVVSHTSVLLIGLFSLSPLAFQGSVMLMVNFGLAISVLLFMTGFIYRRTRTLLLARLGGLFDVIPLVGVAFLIGGLSIIGMPGTPGFDAAHLMLEGTIERFGALVTIAAALGNVVAAGFLLWAFQRAFFAPLNENEKPVQEGTRPLEAVIALGMILVLLGVGFYSEPWLNLIEPALEPLAVLYGTAEH
jgi:NADH-quinone oxidoreductase subunit M